VFAALLQKLGNPGNMGICVACFERDIAGAVGLHRAAVVQYMRPEIIGDHRFCFRLIGCRKGESISRLLCPANAGNPGDRDNTPDTMSAGGDSTGKGNR